MPAQRHFGLHRSFLPRARSSKVYIGLPVTHEVLAPCIWVAAIQAPLCGSMFVRQSFSKLIIGAFLGFPVSSQAIVDVCGGGGDLTFEKFAILP